jgi:hypothetical protein
VSNARLLVVTSAPASSEATQTLEAACTGGKIAMGAGARILGASTDTPPAGVMVVDYPVGVSGTPGNIWKAEAMEFQAVEENWRVELRVTCADAADE